MELTEPQVWTLIGVFAAMLFSSIAVLVRQNDKLIASVRIEIGARFEGLRSDFDSRFDSIDAKFDANGSRFDSMETKFDARLDAMDVKFSERLGSIDRRLEDLDKEVANLATRFWKSS